MAYKEHSSHFGKRAANKESTYLKHQGYSTKVEKKGSKYKVSKQKGKYATN
jgi:hypothetical protein